MFDADGVDDLAVGLASGDLRTVFAATELAAAGKLTQVTSAGVIQDFVPSFVYGDASGVQDLATLLVTGDLINGGRLTVHTCGDDVFASGEQVSFDLRGMTLDLPCIKPVSLAAVGRLVNADRSSVRRWLREAGVRAFVFGSGRNAAVRFRAADVEAWLASRASVT